MIPRAAHAAAMLLTIFIIACGVQRPLPAPPSEAASLTDPRATPETRALFVNLRSLAAERLLFGHQDDLAYGYRWEWETGRSDVKESAGSYPAVYGWDVGDLEHDARTNLDRVRFERMRDWILEGYRRGGVITVSWHMDNPASGGNSWDTTRAVRAILPGGGKHATYRQWLDRFGAFAKSLQGPGRSGRVSMVPVIFRPFHEMSGSWFWWGGRHTTPDEYRRLWRFTVHYLRDTLEVHNLLYAYSPNAVGDQTREKFLEMYPGDDYVDVLGLDEYFTPPRAGGPSQAEALTEHLRALVEIAEARGKIPALTETGYETVPDSTWWTGTLLRAIERDSVARRIAWVLVWRNANRARESRDHYYAPYPGHPSATDFKRFRDHPFVLFEDELPDLYSLPRR